MVFNKYNINQYNTKDVLFTYLYEVYNNQYYKNEIEDELPNQFPKYWWQNNGDMMTVCAPT